MKVSVCMGIYNGEKYIEEQLICILHQTLKPDEVILCDDGSSDRTVQIVQKFIEDNCLEEVWKLYVNEHNLGYPANFYHAMGLCTGDIVFLADQDDIWNVHKIEKMANIMETNTGIMCLGCKFGLVDDTGKNIHSLMNPTGNHGTGAIRNITAKDVFYKCEWPGMVLAYRNAWYRSRSEQGTVVSTVIPHDFWLCACAAEDGGFGQLDEELACHRRHDNNAGGEEHRLRKLLNKQRKIKEIRDYLRILNAFAKEKVLKTKDGMNSLEEKRSSMQDRLDALQSGKISQVLSNAKKHRGQVRFMTLVCDVVIVRQK